MIGCNTSGSEIESGTVLAEYVPPAPPIGIHRYVILLYRQKAGTNVTVMVPLTSLCSELRHVRGFTYRGSIDLFRQLGNRVNMI